MNVLQRKLLKYERKNGEKRCDKVNYEGTCRKMKGMKETVCTWKEMDAENKSTSRRSPK